MSNFALNLSQTHSVEIDSIPLNTLIGYLHKVDEVGFDQLLSISVGDVADRDALLNYIGETLQTFNEYNIPWPESVFSLFNINNEDLEAHKTAIEARDAQMLEDLHSSFANAPSSDPEASIALSLLIGVHDGCIESSSGI